MSQRYSGLDKNQMAENGIKINRFDAFRNKSYTEYFTSTAACVEQAMINVPFLSTRSSNGIIALCDGLHNILSTSCDATSL